MTKQAKKKVHVPWTEAEDLLVSTRASTEYLAKFLPDRSVKAIIHRRYILRQKGAAARQFITQREADIITMLSHGQTNKQIAEELNISFRTVEKHIDNAKKVTRAKNKTHLVRIGFEIGLLKLKKKK